MEKEQEVYILVIDTGSSSMRGLLIDGCGRIAFTHQINYFMQVTEDAAEQDCLCYKDSLTAICRAAAAKCREQGWELIAISFTSQRSSVLPLDLNGEALCPILMWYDKRSSSLCRAVSQEQSQALYNICGLRPTPVLSAPKMRWLRENQPDIYSAAYKLAGIHDYLLYLATGRFVTDTSLAGRTGLLDLRNGQWSPALLIYWGIELNKLCDIIRPGDIAGSVSHSFAEATSLPEGLPVITAGGDQQCSLLGQSITRPGDIGITSGTASYAAMLADRPLTDRKMRINISPACLPGRFVLEASNMSSGAVYAWIRKLFYPDSCSYTEINQEAQHSGTGANGLLMLPDLAGKGCPQWEDTARGSFYNISFQHGRQDFARAALEGVCAEIAECYEVLQECHTASAGCCAMSAGTAVTSAGGLARSDLFNQIIADMICRPVTACPVSETTALGAWSLAAGAMGIYTAPGDALKAAARTRKYEEKKRAPGAPKVFMPNAQNSVYYKNQAKHRLLLRSTCNSTRHAEPLSRLP